jgi:hypothetical protein
MACLLDLFGTLSMGPGFRRDDDLPCSRRRGSIARLLDLFGTLSMGPGFRRMTVCRVTV